MVARLDVVVADLARSQLEDAVGFEADAGKAPGTQTMPCLNDAVVLVERDHVDSEAHPERVHAGGWANEEAGAIVESGLSEKAEQSR